MSRELTRLRRRIDQLDRTLVRRLAERQRLVEAVARLKGDPRRVRDPVRIEAVLANVVQAAAAGGLSRAIAEPVWRVLMDRSADHEAALLTTSPSLEQQGACCGCRDGPVAPKQGASGPEGA